MPVGNGPYRQVADSELRAIFYLTSQSAISSFWFVPKWLSTTSPPPGTDKPHVTQLLREMLYVYANPARVGRLRHTIATQLSGRNDIAIRAKLLSILDQMREKPWAYPACLNEKSCRQFHKQLNSIVEKSDTAANLASDPFTTPAVGGITSAAASRLKPLTAQRTIGAFASGALAVSMVNFFAGKSKDYYDFYTKRISDELALRGIPPSSL